MEGIDKPHTGKYKEITNDSNYDASCALTSLPAWDLENFKRFIFVVQSVHSDDTLFGQHACSRPSNEATVCVILGCLSHVTQQKQLSQPYTRRLEMAVAAFCWLLLSF
jgi:hypothetical protein